MTGAPTFDLQAHSLHSDGALPAAQVVAAAAAAGVRRLALSDHDTVDGVAEALAAGRQHGVSVVTATELSSIDPAGRDLHILGYGIDHNDAALARALAEFRADRERRAERMTAVLNELGFALDEAVIDARRAAGKPVGRPHLAQAVVGAPANAKRLSEEDLHDASDFLVAYLIEGRPAFRDREIPTVADAVQTIHAAGGVAVWAHPFWDVSEPEQVLATIDRFRGVGIDGVEAFYVTHTREQTELVAGRCAELGLLSTGSSDFHGPDHPRFNAFLSFSLFGLEPELGPVGTD
jgi:predicted metal-dependent phosphoesterase TrpH